MPAVLKLVAVGDHGLQIPRDEPKRFEALWVLLKLLLNHCQYRLFFWGGGGGGWMWMWMWVDNVTEEEEEEKEEER